MADVAAQGLQGRRLPAAVLRRPAAVLARYPNFDPQNPYGGGWAYVDGKPVPMYEDVPGEDQAHARTTRPQDARALGAARGGRGLHLPALQLVEQHRAASRRSTARSAHDHAGRRLLLRHPARRPLLRAERPRGTRRAGRVVSRPARPGRSTSGRRRRWTGKPVCAPTLRTIVEIGHGAAHVTLPRLRPSSAARARPSCSRRRERLPDRRLHDPQRRRLQRLGRGDRRRPAQRRRRAATSTRSAATASPSAAATARRSRRPATTPTTTTSTTSACSTSRAWASPCSGVGNRAAHNLIHDGPRMGIIFSGNNLRHRVQPHPPREPGDRGHRRGLHRRARLDLAPAARVIRYNYFHDILGYGREGRQVGLAALRLGRLPRRQRRRRGRDRQHRGPLPSRRDCTCTTAATT